MLKYDKIDVSEGMDVKKTRECDSYASKECDICHYWYFLNHSFKFQPNSAIGVMIYQLCLSILVILLVLTFKVLIITVLLV